MTMWKQEEGNVTVTCYTSDFAVWAEVLYFVARSSQDIIHPKSIERWSGRADAEMRAPAKRSGRHGAIILVLSRTGIDSTETTNNIACRRERKGILVEKFHMNAPINEPNSADAKPQTNPETAQPAIETRPTDSHSV